MRVLDIPEAERISGRGRSTLYKLIASGALRAKKMGGRTVILSTDMDEFLNALPDAREVGAVRSKSTA